MSGNINFSQMGDQSIEVTEDISDAAESDLYGSILFGSGGIIDLSKMGDLLLEGINDSFDAAESAKLQAKEAISEGIQTAEESTKKPYWENFWEEIQNTRRNHHSNRNVPVDESSKPCIFKVPSILRGHTPKSFTPNTFSFGPLHHHAQENLKGSEEIKKHYLCDLLSRKPTSQLEEFKRSILQVEESARKCYAFSTNQFDKDQFVGMLILDGCFIIEVLRRKSITSMHKNDPVFSAGWVPQVLFHDLILLGNQIPWFVLERLFEMTYVKPGSEPLTKLALNFFRNFFSKDSLLSIEPTHKSNHILDLLRKSLLSSTEIFSGDSLPSIEPTHKSNHIHLSRKSLVSWMKNDSHKSNSPQKPSVYLYGGSFKSSGDWKPLPTATTLNELGIRFKRHKSSNLLDIKFSKGVLEIPSFLIQGSTCDAFRNLISYEQCYNCQMEISSYVVLLKNLICTTKDINVLREAGIIDNWLKPNDMLDFIHNIFTDSYEKEFYFAKICENVNEYTNRCWPRTRAAYVRMFWDPIGSLSLFAAAIALILTLLQTLFTILQYIQSFNPTSRPP